LLHVERIDRDEYRDGTGVAALLIPADEMSDSCCAAAIPESLEA
jgi:hypothetical protein